MALYDMRCKDCGERFELFCSAEKMKAAVCPKCGSANVSQVYTSVAVLKGGSSGTPRSSAGPSRRFG